VVTAHAEVALLMEEPFARFGTFNPTGHAAVYLSRICAASPVSLRMCSPGESGVVISRYYKVGGYDWLAVPLIPYLYAVDQPEEVPPEVDARSAALLRDDYRRRHFRDIAPDGENGEAPDGNWIQLVGSAYDRRIYVLEIDTDEEQDMKFVEEFNSRPNKSRFNLLFQNCAGFASGVLNFFHPHSVHRSFFRDLGMSTPKQATRSLMKYAKRHPGVQFRAFVIAQQPGSIGRSRPIRGVLESLIAGPEYGLPAAALFAHPWVMAGAGVAYLTHFFVHSDHRFPGDIGVPLKPTEIARTLSADEPAVEAVYRRQ